MSSAPGALPAVRRLSTSARRSSSTSITTLWKMSAASIWFSMSSAATSRSGLRADPSRRNAGDYRRPDVARPADGRTVDFVVVPDRAQLREIVRRARDGRVRQQTSAPWLPSTMPSPPSTRPNGSRERR